MIQELNKPICNNKLHPQASPASPTDFSDRGCPASSKCTCPIRDTEPAPTYSTNPAQEAHALTRNTDPVTSPNAQSAQKAFSFVAQSQCSPV